jgi:hypothetical protein
MKNVLRLVLNEFKEDESRISYGAKFQRAGPAFIKARSPKDL